MSRSTQSSSLIGQHNFYRQGLEEKQVEVYLGAGEEGLAGQGQRPLQDQLYGKGNSQEVLVTDVSGAGQRDIYEAVQYLHEQCFILQDLRQRFIATAVDT